MPLLSGARKPRKERREEREARRALVRGKGKGLMKRQIDTRRPNLQLKVARPNQQRCWMYLHPRRLLNMRRLRLLCDPSVFFLNVSFNLTCICVLEQCIISVFFFWGSHSRDASSVSNSAVSVGWVRYIQDCVGYQYIHLVYLPATYQTQSLSPIRLLLGPERSLPNGRWFVLLRSACGRRGRRIRCRIRRLGCDRCCADDLEVR